MVLSETTTPRTQNSPTYSIYAAKLPYLPSFCTIEQNDYNNMYEWIGRRRKGQRYSIIMLYLKGEVVATWQLSKLNILWSPIHITIKVTLLKIESIIVALK